MIKLKEIINELKEIRTETKTKVSDELIFENAVKIYISNSINESKKQKNFEVMTKENIANENKIQLATDSQKWKLKKLGYKGDLNKLNKLEAMKLISSIQGSLNEHNN
jgi:hypothetical protein